MNLPTALDERGSAAFEDECAARENQNIIPRRKRRKEMCIRKKQRDSTTRAILVDCARVLPWQVLSVMVRH